MFEDPRRRSADVEIAQEFEKHERERVSEYALHTDHHAGLIQDLRIEHARRALETLNDSKRQSRIVIKGEPPPPRSGQGLDSTSLATRLMEGSAEKHPFDREPKVYWEDRYANTPAEKRQSSRGDAADELLLPDRIAVFAFWAVVVVLGVVALNQVSCGDTDCESLKSEYQARLAGAPTVDGKIQALRDFDRRAKSAGCY